MEYQLTILKRELNPEYQEKRHSYQTEQDRFLSERRLEVTVTQEQFEAIRKAVLDKF